MRLLFVIRLPLARRAAGQRGAQHEGGDEKRKSNPESHAVKLVEPSGSCNRRLRAALVRRRQVLCCRLMP